MLLRPSVPRRRSKRADVAVPHATGPPDGEPQLPALSDQQRRGDRRERDRRQSDYRAIAGEATIDATPRPCRGDDDDRTERQRGDGVERDVTFPTRERNPICGDAVVPLDRD